MQTSSMNWHAETGHPTSKLPCTSPTKDSDSNEISYQLCISSAYMSQFLKREHQRVATPQVPHPLWGVRSPWHSGHAHVIAPEELH